MKPVQKKMVLSLRNVRLASTSGHIVMVPAGKPTQIPEQLYIEAAKQGCVDFHPQMVEAFKNAMAAAEASVEQPSSEPSVDHMELMATAVKQVMLAADETLMTSAGVPRVPAVRAAYDVICAQHKVDAELKVTPELISDVFLRVQDEQAEPEASDSTRYPADFDVELVEDEEEVGGVTEELLARVTK